MKQETVDNVRLLLQEGKMDEAERLLDKVLQEDNRDSDAYYWMGNLHRKRCNWKLALQAYAQAIELNPRSQAREARQMLLDIVQFRDVQRYNV